MTFVIINAGTIKIINNERKCVSKVTIDDSRVTLQIVASLTRGIIYDLNMFIVQTIGRLTLKY